MTHRQGRLVIHESKLEKEARVTCRAVSAWFRRQVSDGAPPGPELDHTFSGWRKCSHLHSLSSEDDVGSSQLDWPGELVGKKPGG